VQKKGYAISRFAESLRMVGKGQRSVLKSCIRVCFQWSFSMRRTPT
jgi:hypothetical protein